jgi:glycosyltransferase involved in cell wall biosynthesis
VPVVATPVWGTPEVICLPEYGVLVKERSAEALADGIEKGLKTEWQPEKMIAYAQQNTWDNVARKVVSIFEEVLE